MLSLSIIASTFVLIFVAELPDKTALATLVLGARYKTSHVIIGAWLAFVVQTLIAVLAGSLLTLLPEMPVRVAAGLAFLVFAYLSYKQNEEEIEESEEKEASMEGKRGYPVWVTSFLVVFVAEWGDLTQLATAALVAHTGQPLSVGIGALAALWTVTVIAAFAGSQLTRFINLNTLSKIAAGMFAVIGIAIIAIALGA